MAPTLSSDQQAALELLLAPKWETPVIMVSGAAGTGKSTLLNLFRELADSVAVVAPTGVAAMNVRGQTIHSHFGIPPRLLRLENPDDIPRVNPFTPRGKVLKATKILIIDEISMVRVDILDAIDYCLRRSLDNDRPFAGKKVVLFGDLVQLDPVVSSPAEKEYIEDVWGGPFFFQAKIWERVAAQIIRLDTQHRQSQDASLAEALQSIRERNFTGLETLNQRVVSRGELVSGSVSLVPRRSEADRINAQHLMRIAGEPRTFEAAITGRFKDRDAPTDVHLQLKVGAQVMFVRNGDAYVNGTLGTVTEITPETVWVRIDDATNIPVPAAEWEQIEYRYNSSSRELNTEVIGTFRQVPLRPAWALTVHKAQGLTLDHVHVDPGSGFFTHGQGYVAVSRCRTLQGLTLGRPLKPQDFHTDDRIFEFTRHCERHGTWGTF